MASLHNLNINVGKQAVALVKAPWVVLMTDAAGYRLSARNSLEGEVLRVGDGAVNAEVVLKLSGGTEVYAIVTREAVQELGLKPGVKATALIKASHIILGAKPDRMPASALTRQERACPAMALAQGIALIPLPVDETCLSYVFPVDFPAMLCIKFTRPEKRAFISTHEEFNGHSI